MRRIRSSSLPLLLVLSSGAALAQNPNECIDAPGGGALICEPHFPGPWSYGACDETAGFCFRYNAWCSASGGTPGGCGTTCTGSTPMDEGNIVSRSVTFANQIHGGGCSITSDTGWGGNFYSYWCTGQSQDVYKEGFLTNTYRQLGITCTSGGETISLSKTRQLECPTGFTERFTPSRGYVCVYPTEPCDSCGVGNPIMPGSGVKVESATDTPAGSPLQFSRYYHSMRFVEPATAAAGAHTDNRLGDIWRGTFDTRVIPLGATTAVSLVNGDLQYFDSTGSELLNYQRPTTALVTAPGGWYLNGPEGTQQYRSDGRLVATTSRAGARVALTYSFIPDAGFGPDGGALDAGPPPYFAVDPNGNATNLALRAGLPVRATDSSGRSLSFAYDPGGRLVTMTDWTGARTFYRYDPKANLASVTWPDGTTVAYRYNEATNVNGWANPSHALTSITDENDAGFASFQYDPSGRAISTLHGADAGRFAIAFGTDGGNVVTDPLGTVRTFGFATTGGLTRFTGGSQAGGEGYGAGLSKLEYDPAGNVTARYDFLGRKTCLGYSGRLRLPTVLVEALPQATACASVLSDGATLPAGSRRTVIEYHPRWGVPVRVATAGLLTTSVFNGDLVQGSPVTCAPQGAVVDDGSMAGQPIGVVCTELHQGTDDVDGSKGFGATPTGTPRQWARTYDAEGRLLTVDGPRTDVMDVTTYTYYPTSDPDIGKRGNLATVMDALGHVTQYTQYAPTGKPTQIIDPNGVVTKQTYDARQRMIATETSGERTTYTYDAAGQLVRVTWPDGSTKGMRYDSAHRLIELSDVDGNVIDFTLDAMGNRTGEWRYDAMGVLLQQRTFVYDAFNRRIAELGANGEMTSFAFDGAGNLLSRTDPLGHVTQYAYDTLDRRTQVTLPDQSTQGFSYGPRDELLSFTDGRGLATRYTYSELGELLKTESPDEGTQVTTRDAAGNALTRTDAKGQLTQLDYDALNRVRHAHYADGSTAEWRYDEGTNGVGRLTTLIDATGTTMYRYDDLGRVIGETVIRRNGSATATFTTSYGYDGQGRLVKMTYPSGRAINYQYDSQGRVSHADLQAGAMSVPLADAVHYRPFAAVKSFTAVGGAMVARTFDANGRVAGYTLGGVNVGVGYDADGRVTSVGGGMYGYDEVDRLVQASGPSGMETFAYDVGGNRTSSALGGAAQAFSYGSTSNQMVQSGSAMRSYDANGSLLDDGTRRFTYDARGRLSQVDVGAVKASYAVDGLGRRVSKSITRPIP